MDSSLAPAELSDLHAIAALMNAAFRGAASDRNWSVESGYIVGERTNEGLLRDEVDDGARFLLAKDEGTRSLLGCVSLRVLSPGAWYLGSLTVDPMLQNSGFGRKLLHAAEEYAVQHGARTIEMTVVHVRDSLISWYERRGYSLTGERRPFPYGDDRFGTPTREDLEFVVLEKRLAASAPA
jgi:ribosomal protein S18 acetylase RimI-like enzyme